MFHGWRFISRQPEISLRVRPLRTPTRVFSADVTGPSRVRPRGDAGPVSTVSVAPRRWGNLQETACTVREPSARASKVRSYLSSPSLAVATAPPAGSGLEGRGEGLRHSRRRGPKRSGTLVVRRRQSPREPTNQTGARRLEESAASQGHRRDAVPGPRPCPSAKGCLRDPRPRRSANPQSRSPGPGRLRQGALARVAVGSTGGARKAARVFVAASGSRHPSARPLIPPRRTRPLGSCCRARAGAWASSWKPFPATLPETPHPFAACGRARGRLRRTIGTMLPSPECGAPARYNGPDVRWMISSGYRYPVQT